MGYFYDENNNEDLNEDLNENRFEQWEGNDDTLSDENDEINSQNEDSERAQERARAPFQPPFARRPIANNELHYSKQACDDGYDFSCLDDEAQERTKFLYVSEQALSDYVLAQQRSYSNHKQKNSYHLGVPKDGRYFGFIHECKPSSKAAEKYILQLLMSDCDINSFMFSQNSFDPVFAAISDRAKIGKNIFRSSNYVDSRELKGLPVIIDVVNSDYADGAHFSNIKRIWFLSEADEAILDDMVDIMCEQAAKRS